MYFSFSSEMNVNFNVKVILNTHTNILGMILDLIEKELFHLVIELIEV